MRGLCEVSRLEMRTRGRKSVVAGMVATENARLLELV